MVDLETALRSDVHEVIEETQAAFTAYSDYDYMNADFANFASMSLGRFKDALKRPDLTGEDLENWLRKGMLSHRQENQAQSCWTTFMARYVSKASNGN